MRVNQHVTDHTILLYVECMMSIGVLYCTVVYLISFKEDISQVEDRGQDPENAILVFNIEVKDLHGTEEPAEVFPVTLTTDLTVTTLTINNKPAIKNRHQCLSRCNTPL